MKRFLLVPITACAFSAALASEIVPMGENLYSVSKTSAACGFGSTGKLKTAMLKDINKFCDAKGLLPEMVTIQAEEGIIGQRCARATLEFRCVTSASANTTAPSGRRPDRDTNRDPLVPADRGQLGRRSDEPYVIRSEVQVSEPKPDKYTQLARLKALLDSEAITREEYEAEKKKILDQP